MKTLAKLLLLATLTLSSSAFAMKTIDLVDKAQMTDQQKMDLAQKLAEKQDWKAVFELCILLRWKVIYKRKAI